MVVFIQAIIRIAGHGNDTAGFYINGYHGARFGFLTAGGGGIVIQVADTIGQSLLGGGLHTLHQGKLHGVSGHGFLRFFHPDDIALLILHHGAQTVLPAQLILHHPLNAAFAQRIADAVAGGIGEGIGLFRFLQLVVFLAADGPGDPQHMGSQTAGQVGAHRDGNTIYARQTAAAFFNGSQQRIADIGGKGIGIVAGKFRLRHGIADPRQQPLLLLGVAVHTVLRPQGGKELLIGGVGGLAEVPQPVQRLGIAQTLYLIAAAQPVQHIGIGVVIQVIELPQPVQGVLRGGGLA